jgi:hypothetical protein
MDVHAGPAELPELKAFWGASRCSSDVQKARKPWSGR